MKTLRLPYQTPRVEVRPVELCYMVAFSDDGQQSPGGNDDTSPGFNDWNMSNPDIASSPGSFGDWDM